MVPRVDFYTDSMLDVGNPEKDLPPACLFASAGVSFAKTIHHAKQEDTS